MHYFTDSGTSMKKLFAGHLEARYQLHKHHSINGGERNCCDLQTLRLPFAWRSCEQGNMQHATSCVAGEIRIGYLQKERQPNDHLFKLIRYKSFYSEQERIAVMLFCR